MKLTHDWLLGSLHEYIGVVNKSSVCVTSLSKKINKSKEMDNSMYCDAEYIKVFFIINSADEVGKD